MRNTGMSRALARVRTVSGRGPKPATTYLNPTLVSIRRRVFRQFPLQGPAMDSEQFRCLRYIAVAVGKDALNVLPFHPCKRRYCGRSMLFSRPQVEIGVCSEDLFRIRRFAEVVVGAKLQCLHCCCYASISGKDHYRNCCIELLDVPDEIQSAQARHLQIKQNKIRTHVASQIDDLRGGACIISFAT